MEISTFFNKRTLLKALVAIAGFIVFVLLMDNVIMPLYTKHGQEYELPDVTTRPLNKAVETLEADGFHPIIKDSTYDEHLPPGSIVQQNPLPFSTVKKGRRVYLVVSIGDKPRYIPKLIGLTQQDAEFRLREQGLELNNAVPEFSDFYPRGVVVNQSIPPGEQVDKDQKINITVSLGPAPTSLEIPNLVGKSMESAEKELDAIGVRVGRVKYLYRPNLVPGTILKQFVKPGTNAASVEKVDLLVSSDQQPKEEATDDSTAQSF